MIVAIHLPNKRQAFIAGTHVPKRTVTHFMEIVGFPLPCGRLITRFSSSIKAKSEHDNVCISFLLTVLPFCLLHTRMAP